MDKGYDRKIRYVYNDELNIYECIDKYWKDKDSNMTVEQFSEFKKSLTENIPIWDDLRFCDFLFSYLSFQKNSIN